MNEVNEIQAQVNNYRKNLGQPAEARALRLENKEKLRFRKRYHRAAKQLTKSRKRIALIYRNRVMSPAVKTEKIHDLNRKMQDIMKRNVTASQEVF